MIRIIPLLAMLTGCGDKLYDMGGRRQRREARNVDRAELRARLFRRSEWASTATLLECLRLVEQSADDEHAPEGQSYPEND